MKWKCRWNGYWFVWFEKYYCVKFEPGTLFMNDTQINKSFKIQRMAAKCLISLQWKRFSSVADFQQKCAARKINIKQKWQKKTKWPPRVATSSRFVQWKLFTTWIISNLYEPGSDCDPRSSDWNYDPLPNLFHLQYRRK